MLVPIVNRPVVTAFLTSLGELGCTVLRASDDAEAAAEVVGALRERQVTEVVAWEEGDLAGLKLDEALRAGGIDCHFAGPKAEAEAYRQAAARAGAGITGVDWAVAETGTLVLMSGPGRPRSTSLLPPVHVALVRVEQVVATMADLFRELARLPAEDRVPSSLNMITGASRTADIEHVLVRKVHGPGEVIVVLVDRAS